MNRIFGVTVSFWKLLAGTRIELDDVPNLPDDTISEIDQIKERLTVNDERIRLIDARTASLEMIMKHRLETGDPT